MNKKPLSEAEIHQIALSEELYDCNDLSFVSYQRKVNRLIQDYNRTKESKRGYLKRQKILKKALGTYSEGIFIIPPVYCNFGLKHVHLGKNVFVNYCANFVDDGEITIGDNTLIGPSVVFATAEHPISPRLREHAIQYNLPIHIGKNVWIGAHATILGGVTIGDNAIVGAGAVVTKDVEPNTIVVGNPAKKLRDINVNDDELCNNKPISVSIKETYLKQ